VSFPAAVAASGLAPRGGRRPRDEHGPVDVLQDRVFAKDGAPMLHITKRSCHWYYRSHARCVANQGAEASPPVPPWRGPLRIVDKVSSAKEVRVAIVVAGTLRRYVLQSMVKNFIQPMVRHAPFFVDYYASLTTAAAKSYRSNSGYMDLAGADPIFRGSTDPSVVEDLIRTKVSTWAQSAVGNVIIQDTIDIDSEPLLQAKREQAARDHPGQDPDQRFPSFDVRSGEIAQRTANANRNMLRMHLAVQNLWKSVVTMEQEEGFEYDYVIFARDDSLWLEPFSLWPFIGQTGTDVFVPSCDVRKTPMDAQEINDHIVISRRSAADTFGNYYSKLFEVDMEACMGRLSSKITQNGKRGCNSEMVLKWILDKDGTRVSTVGQGLVPFQRVVNLRLPDGSRQHCFHKFCQSEANPLMLLFGETSLETCSSWSRGKIRSGLDLYDSKTHGVL